MKIQCTVFLLINAPGAMQNIDRELYFVHNLQSKKSVQFCISLCFRDMCLQYKSFENTVEKGEIAQCFLTILKTFCHFHQI